VGVFRFKHLFTPPPVRCLLGISGQVPEEVSWGDLFRPPSRYSQKLPDRGGGEEVAEGCFPAKTDVLPCENLFRSPFRYRWLHNGPDRGLKSLSGEPGRGVLLRESEEVSWGDLLTLC